MSSVSYPSCHVARQTPDGEYLLFPRGHRLTKIQLGKRNLAKAREEPWLGIHPATGFAGISRRLGKKPIIAAVNGFALGGGFEIVLNW